VLLPALHADTYLNARDWLMSAFDLTEDQALTLMTVACDFQVHQVVDGNCEFTAAAARHVSRQPEGSCAWLRQSTGRCVVAGVAGQAEERRARQQ
jgi:hypothetical protein